MEYILYGIIFYAVETITVSPSRFFLKIFVLESLGCIISRVVIVCLQVYEKCWIAISYYCYYFVLPSQFYLWHVYIRKGSESVRVVNIMNFFLDLHFFLIK